MLLTIYIYIINCSYLVGSHFAAHTLGAMKNTIKQVREIIYLFLFDVFFYGCGEKKAEPKIYR